jgi:hypothetical protein
MEPGRDGGKSAGGQLPSRDPADYGRGEYDEETGLWEWYEVPSALLSPSFSWGEVLDHWNLITLDLHDQFGIDCGDRALMRARPWSWMRLRIRSLLQIEGSRLRAVLMP